MRVTPLQTSPPWFATVRVSPMAPEADCDPVLCARIDTTQADRPDNVASMGRLHAVGSAAYPHKGETFAFEHLRER